MNGLQKFAAALALIALTGCAHYVTPGGAANLQEFAGVSETAEESLRPGDATDPDLAAYYETRPAALFPASIAMVRVQDSGYRPHQWHGPGRYTVITARDIETEEAYEQLKRLSGVRGIAPIGRMLVPANANSINDLRRPAAQLQADMLLVYSVDTTFTVGGKQYGPLSAISFGLLRNRTAHVTVTVAGVLVDTRTGFIYGTAESSHTEEKKASIWATRMVVDDARFAAEKIAFRGFVSEFGDLWPGVLQVHWHAAARPRVPPGKIYETGRFND